MALTSTISFPDTLPPPEQSRWREKPYNDIIEFKPEVGPAILRQRSGRVGASYRISLLLDQAQRATLLEFYHTDLFGGVAAFNYLHPHTGVQKTVRFKTNSLTFSAAGPFSVEANFTLEEVTSA